MWRESSIARDVVSRLRAIDVFLGQSEEVLASVASITTPRHVEARQVVYWAGEACSALYLLSEGSVKLSRPIAGGQDRIVDMLGPGSTFGECGLFTGEGYETTAEAIEPCTLLAVAALPFVRFLQAQPVLAWTMMGALARRITRLVDWRVRAVGQSAEERVAEFVLDAAEPARRGEPARVRFLGSKSRRSDVASLLGVRPETLSRVLSEFRRRGVLIETRGALCLVDPAALRSIASTGGTRGTAAPHPAGVSSRSAPRPRRRVSGGEGLRAGRRDG